jgi:hypothetical protein
MLKADFEEMLAGMEADIKRPPENKPPKRRQPKIKRMLSARQQIAMSQTPNMYRAIFVPEHERNQTPTMPIEWRGTKEVGPNDRYGSRHESWRTGKATIEAVTGYSKTKYRDYGKLDQKTTPSGEAVIKRPRVPKRDHKIDVVGLASQFDIDL